MRYPFGLDPVSLREEHGRYVCVSCDGVKSYFDCTNKNDPCVYDQFCLRFSCRRITCETCGGVGSWPIMAHTGDEPEWPSVHDYGRKRDPDAELIKRVATAIAKERDGALRGESTYPMYEAEARVLIAAFRAFKTS